MLEKTSPIRQDATMGIFWFVTANYRCIVLIKSKLSAIATGQVKEEGINILKKGLEATQFIPIYMTTWEKCFFYYSLRP